MDYINGFTFILRPSENQSFAGDESKESLRKLKESTGSDHIILVVGALQDTPQSEDIDYLGAHMPTDNEVKEMINYIKELGMKVILIISYIMLLLQKKQNVKC